MRIFSDEFLQILRIVLSGIVANIRRIEEFSVNEFCCCMRIFIPALLTEADSAFQLGAVFSPTLQPKPGSIWLPNVMLMKHEVVGKHFECNYSPKNIIKLWLPSLVGCFFELRFDKLLMTIA